MKSSQVALHPENALQAGKMKQWRGTILMLVLLIALLSGLSYYNWYRNRLTPADYITAAQTVSAPGLKKTNMQFLGECCGTVNWQHSRSQDGKELVEATGNLKNGGQPVVVRWEVTILRDRNAKVWIANPVFASVAGREIEPPKDFVTQFDAAASYKESAGPEQPPKKPE
jgi:hypothetical protein